MTDVWGHGLAAPRSGASALTVAEKASEEKALGVRVRPWRDAGLKVGMQVNRAPGLESALGSDVNWRYEWKHHRDEPGSIGFGLSADGAAGVSQRGLSQTVASSIDMPLMRSGSFSAKAALAPQMSFDAVAMTWDAAIVPEIKTRKILNTASSRFRSVLSVKIGSRFALETSPNLMAGLELRITGR
ncbi:hypothetical protein [Microvirga massiliensis]|uniref:hypothetical protein n=1 Tax=Microvirga massiliensis TaxID=1033741 RepID=UPI00062BA085|nr:hypothetical protein [Microvirga massiliensis]